MINEDSEIFRDDLLYCYKCEADYVNYCDKHGVNWKPDKLKHCHNRSLTYPYNLFTKSFSSTIKCDCSDNLGLHIAKTMPSSLRLKESKKNQNRFKVITKDSIKKGTIFGPLFGDVQELEDVDDETDFYERSIDGSGWITRKSVINDVNSFVNYENDFQTNWMKYVESTTSCEFQNLIVIQYFGLLFYRACVDIPPKTELFTHYSIQHERDFECCKGRKYDTSLVIRNSTSNGPFHVNIKVRRPIDMTNTSNNSSKLIDQNVPQNLSQQVTNLPKVCSILPPPKHSISQILSNENKNDHDQNFSAVHCSLNAHTTHATNYDIDPLHTFPRLNRSNQSIIDNTDNINNVIMPPPKSATLVKRKRNSLDENNTQIIKMKIEKTYSNSVPSSSVGNFNFEDDKENKSTYLFPVQIPPKRFIDDDEQLSGYIKRICFLEPYLSLENVITLICRNFPKILLSNYEPISNFIHRHSLRLKSGLWSDPNDQIISMIVKMFEENININGGEVQNRLHAVLPNYHMLDLRLIEDIVKCNFSKQSINEVDYDVIEYIQKIITARYNSSIPIKEVDSLVTELQLSVQFQFPTRFRVSRIVIDDLLKSYVNCDMVNQLQLNAAQSSIKKESNGMDKSTPLTESEQHYLALEVKQALECLDNEEM